MPRRQGTADDCHDARNSLWGGELEAWSALRPDHTTRSPMHGYAPRDEDRIVEPRSVGIHVHAIVRTVRPARIAVVVRRGVGLALLLLDERRALRIDLIARVHAPVQAQCDHVARAEPVRQRELETGVADRARREHAHAALG